MKSPARILIVILIILASIAMIRFISGEDNWICDNGERVKHGIPSGTPPAEDCK
ncbi:hypothetical protein KJ652_07410 [Patescibacteria group bacterium]|nr:hypothetical protein [Patescibacteria group bacterium]MBU1124373.1 hypothetical protein [Patescibacteria group bacterium]MBU1910940.1 hypothetical protein [Patescibacteria group bacterium]